MLLSVSLAGQYSRVPSSELQKVEVRPKEAKVVDLEDMAESIQVLKLENTEESFFGYAARVLVEGDRVIIYTGGRDGKVFVFNTEGQFLFKVEAEGQGPGELDRITNVATDSGDLLVYGDLARKILRFSADGKFLSEHKVDFYAFNFVKLNQGWVFNLQPGSREDGSPEKFVLTDGAFKTQERFLPIEATSLSNASTLSQYLKLRNAVQFGLFQNDTIFSITAAGIEPRYHIDFGKYSMSRSLKYRSYGRDLFERIKNSNHAETRVTHTDLNDLLGFTYIKYNRNTRKDNRVRHVYYSKSRKEIVWHYYRLTLDRFGARLPSAHFQSEDRRVTPISFLQLFEENETELANPKRRGTSTGYGMMSLDEAMAVMKEEDNPYLLMYKVRSGN
ncbi:MAG: hypothetical protein Roseis2KO_42200 [Roseivirga sp.]